MSEDLQQELQAEAEALRVFRAQQDQRRAEERRRTVEDGASALDTLEWPQVRALISERFENARLRNRLAEAERRIAELEHGVARTR